MIAFRNFALRRGERLLLSNVDLALHAGARVGVVGRNGCGKSSLFAAIQGEIEPDKGDLDLPSRLRIASVAQETPSLPDAAIDFVVSGDTEVHAVLEAEAAAMAAEDWDAVADRAPEDGRHQRLRRRRACRPPAARSRVSAPETHRSRCRISPAAGACASISRAR